MAKVRIPPTLRAETGGSGEVQAEGETVRELFADLASRFPSLGQQILRDGDVASFVNVYLDGEDVRTRDGLDSRVDEGSSVILLPAVAGGLS
jgi:sulfur-carrier protein